jgi:hypothetical protein
MVWNDLLIIYLSKKISLSVTKTSFVNAFLLWTSSQVRSFVGRGGLFWKDVGWKLKHDGTYHLTVFLPKEMRMVNKARVFDELIMRHIEIRIIFLIFIIIWLCPSDSKYKHLSRFNQRCILPSSVILSNETLAIQHILGSLIRAKRNA